MVECGGLENRCPGFPGPGVRIPPFPQAKLMKTRRHTHYTILIFFILFSTILGQNAKENWVSVNIVRDYKTYINTANLTDTKKDDIYVWVMDEFIEPLTLEGIDGKIYQAKTYYLLNKKKMKYSILQVIYFDEDKNVLKSFSYEHNSKLTDFKYSSPILKNTDIAAVLSKCLELEEHPKN